MEARSAPIRSVIDIVTIEFVDTEARLILVSLVVFSGFVSISFLQGLCFEFYALSALF